MNDAESSDGASRWSRRNAAELMWPPARRLALPSSEFNGHVCTTPRDVEARPKDLTIHVVGRLRVREGRWTRGPTAWRPSLHAPCSPSSPVRSSRRPCRRARRGRRDRASVQASPRLDEPIDHADGIVRATSSLVARHQSGARMRRSGGDQGVIGGTPGYARAGQSRYQRGVGSGGKRKPAVRESFLEERRDHVARGAMRRWKPREHRVALEAALSDEACSGIEQCAGICVPLMPRGERSDDDAGVHRDQRRTDSSASRTSSAVSSGSSRSVTATTPLPRFTSRIGSPGNRSSAPPGQARRRRTPRPSPEE